MVLVSAVVSCGRGGRVIPVRKMERIYREMLLADQWLAENPDKRGIADTTWFYEPILRSMASRSVTTRRVLTAISMIPNVMPRCWDGWRRI